MYAGSVKYPLWDVTRNLKPISVRNMIIYFNYFSNKAVIIIPLMKKKK